MSWKLPEIFSSPLIRSSDKLPSKKQTSSWVLMRTGFCFICETLWSSRTPICLDSQTFDEGGKSREKENDINRKYIGNSKCIQSRWLIALPVEPGNKEYNKWVPWGTFFPFQLLPLAIFTLQFPPPFLVFKSGYEYISAKLHKWPTWLSLGGQILNTTWKRLQWHPLKTLFCCC